MSLLERLVSKQPPKGVTLSWYWLVAVIFLGYLGVPLAAYFLLHQNFWVLQVAGLGFWGALFGWLIYKNGWQSVKNGIAFRWDGWKSTIPHGIYIFLNLLIIAFSLTIALQVQGIKPPNPYAGVPPEYLWQIAIYAVTLAPIQEEIVFRGMVQETCHRYLPAWGSILVTTLIFALFHANYSSTPLALLYVLVLGLILSFYRERYNSIIPCIIAHWLNNCIAAGNLFAN